MSVSFWGWACPYCDSDIHPMDYELEENRIVPCDNCGKNIKGIYLKCQRIEEKMEKMISDYEEKCEELKNKEEVRDEIRKR